MASKRNVIRVAVAAGLALALAACGGKSPAAGASPAAPSATASPAPTVVVGATVSGTVAVASGPAVVTAAPGIHDTTYSIVVSVDGTSLSTVADGVGHFKLTGVPSGTVQLKFSGNGMQGSITLSGVKDADDISVAVTLTTTGAALDQTQQTDPAGTVEIEGRISALKPGGVANTVTVDSTTVSILPTADIRHGATVLVFADLQVGDRIHVKGIKSGQTVVANEVMVQNDNATVPVNVNGDVAALLSGSCPAIRFTLAGWTVETDATTSFDKGPCSGIAKGTSVHVKGAVQSSGRVLATWVQTGK